MYTRSLETPLYLTENISSYKHLVCVCVSVRLHRRKEKVAVADGGLWNDHAHDVCQNRSMYVCFRICEHVQSELVLNESNHIAYQLPSNICARDKNAKNAKLSIMQGGYVMLLMAQHTGHGTSATAGRVCVW